MEINFNRVMIYDGSYLLHRNLSQPNQWEMINSKGKRTGGIYGVLRSIIKESKDYNFYPVVIFDGGLSKRRLNIYPNYKKNIERQALLECKEEDLTEEQLFDLEFKREYSTQRNDLMQLLPLFGIPVIRINDWEGDDLIYILSKMSKNSIVVSDDKDILQLVYEDDNRRCKIWRPMKEELWDINTLQEKDMDIQKYIGCKCIVGDPSDNIPSACFQVGEKTAPGLYELYTKSINIGFPKNEEDLTKKCKDLNVPKRKAYLNFNEDQFLTNVLLTDLRLIDEDVTEDVINNIKTTIYTECKPFEQNNRPEIYSILDDLEIKTLDVETLYSRIDSLIDHLKIEDLEKSLPIREDNKSVSGLSGGLFKFMNQPQ